MTGGASLGGGSDSEGAAAGAAAAAGGVAGRNEQVRRPGVGRRRLGDRVIGAEVDRGVAALPDDERAGLGAAARRAAAAARAAAGGGAVGDGGDVGGQR